MREGRVTWARRFAVAPVEECEGERGTPESYVKIGKLLATARLPIVERTESEPEEDGARFLGAAPAAKTLLERLA